MKEFNKTKIAVTPCVYLNYHEAEVQVLKRTLSHNSYLDCCSVRIWFKGEPISGNSLLNYRY